MAWPVSWNDVEGMSPLVIDAVELGFDIDGDTNQMLNNISDELINVIKHKLDTGMITSIAWKVGPVFFNAIKVELDGDLIHLMSYGDNFFNIETVDKCIIINYD